MAADVPSVVRVRLSPALDRLIQSCRRIAYDPIGTPANHSSEGTNRHRISVEGCTITASHLADRGWGALCLQHAGQRLVGGRAVPVSSRLLLERGASVGAAQPSRLRARNRLY